MLNLFMGLIKISRIYLIYVSNQTNKTYQLMKRDRHDILCENLSAIVIQIQNFTTKQKPKVKKAIKNLYFGRIESRIVLWLFI